MYLGIDIGTSSVKAVLINDAGTVVDQASAPLTVQRPKPGWSEQNPADWWEATNRAVTSLSFEKRHSVRAAGLSGQMHGATLLGAGRQGASSGNPVERRPQRGRVCRARGGRTEKPEDHR